MDNFNTKRILHGAPSLIPEIARKIEEYFNNDGYDVISTSLSSGGCDISITKGGLFKAVLGMRTALKVTLLPIGGNISLEAGVGIWGQQAIPTVISMLFFWPVIFTQLCGLVQQSKLDDKVVEIAEEVAYASPQTVQAAPTGDFRFCTSCGTKNPADAKFCCGCGNKM